MNYAKGSQSSAGSVHVAGSVWHANELTFTAENQADNPYLDVPMHVVFTSPTGDTFTVPGFWDGENNWKVRFAPNMVGLWEWESVSDDPGLGGKRGSLEATSYSGNNPINRNGFVRASERGFFHDDGTPFFWLGDTVWSVSAHALLEEWQQYLEYRSKQGFNVVQLNSLPQWDASDGAFRKPFAEVDGNYDYSKPNPDYFRYLDRLVESASAAGMITAMVVLWFNYVPETNIGWNMVWKKPFDASAAQAYASYLAARYAAYGTVWLVSGDTDYDSATAREFYDIAALAVRESSPYPAMLTAHLNGGLYTPDSLNEKEWLDFHMFQSCHFRNSANKAIYYADMDRKYHPIRPVLNGEPCYDYISFLDRDNDDKRIIDRAFVRETAWTSVLGGANSGLTYGAHGLWPWHREGQSYGPMQYGMPLSWQDALRLESGEDMSRLRRMLEQYRWWELQPLKAIRADADDARVAASTAPDNKILVYVSKPSSLRIFCDFDPTVAYWYDPSSGLRSPADALKQDSEVAVAPPEWKGDAVLVLEGGE